MQVGSIVKFKGTFHTESSNLSVTDPMHMLAVRQCYGVVRGFPLPNLVKVSGLSHTESQAVFAWDTMDLEEVSVTLQQAVDFQIEMDLADEAIENDSEEEEVVEQPFPSHKVEDKESSKKKEEELSKLSDFNEVDYTTPLKKINTTHNFLFIGNLVDSKFLKKDFFSIRECCSLFKEDVACTDIIMTVPIDWCNYMGYSEDIIIRWVEFINRLDFPSKVIYEGLKEIDNKLHREQPYYEYNPVFLRRNLYYHILIPSTEYQPLNYLVYMLLRYLSLSKYNNLPGLSLKLKDNLPELSNWQILMLSHIISPCFPEFSLLDLDISPQSLYVPDINNQENKEPAYFRRLLNAFSVNNSFVYKRISQSYLEKLLKLTKGRDYDGIRIWIKELDENEMKEDEVIIRKIKSKRNGLGWSQLNHSIHTHLSPQPAEVAVDSIAPPILDPALNGTTLTTTVQ